MATRAHLPSSNARMRVRRPGDLAALLDYLLALAFTPERRGRGRGDGRLVRAAKDMHVSYSLLSEIRSQKKASLTVHTYEAFQELIARHTEGGERTALLRHLLWCFHEPEGAVLRAAATRWEADALQGWQRQAKADDFWIWSPSGLRALPKGGKASWRQSMRISDPVMRTSRGAPRWPDFLVYDAYRLLRHIRERPRLAAPVIAFARQLRSRGFDFDESPEDLDAGTTGLLFMFDGRPPAAGERKHMDRRVALAWQRVWAPLLAARSSPLERSWQELGADDGEELAAYLEAATAAELILLNRRPNDERALELSSEEARAGRQKSHWDLTLAQDA